MPAVTMLEGGSWTVPYVGGKPFLRKPPLVQWCMAASMKVFGRTTWAVRLPSALSVLALALVLILGTRGWLIAEQSLLAAIIMMVQIATIEKCRLAELEAIYVSLSGIAVVLWMSWWSQARSPWLTWTVPLVFNGLALLAKAPLHLLFFYAVVVATLAANRPLAGPASSPLTLQKSPAPRGRFRLQNLRELWRLPHLVGLALMLAIFGAWLFLYTRQVPAHEAGQVWWRQFVERVTGAEMDLPKWLLNVPSGLSNHLPWVLFVLLLWRRDATEGLHERTTACLRGGRWAVAACFLCLLLIPGVLPRYVQPLVAPFSVLLALVLWECPAHYQRWWRASALGLTVLLFLASLASPFIVMAAMTRGAVPANPIFATLGIFAVFAGALLLIFQRKRLNEAVHLALWTALLAAMGMLLVATCAGPWMRLQDDLRPFAAEIDKTLPPNTRLVAYSMDDFAPLLAAIFYLKSPVDYAPEPDLAPAGDRYYLIRGKDWDKFQKRFTILGDPIAQWPGKGEKRPAVVIKARVNPKP
jgi:4-amino-4-deoxy-L-arabinose transferase-like glycosyltransferase